MQVQGDAALTEEGLIKRSQPCWLLAEGCLPFPDLSPHLCSSNLSSHTSFSPYNSTASFPQNSKQKGLKSFLSGPAVKCHDKSRNRGETPWSQHKPLQSVLQCVRLNDQILWSLLAIKMQALRRWWHPCRKLAQHFPEDTWLAILQNFRGRKLPWEILKQ